MEQLTLQMGSVESRQKSCGGKSIICSTKTLHLVLLEIVHTVTSLRALEEAALSTATAEGCTVRGRAQAQDLKHHALKVLVLGGSIEKCASNGTQPGLEERWPVDGLLGGRVRNKTVIIFRPQCLLNHARSVEDEVVANGGLAKLVLQETKVGRAIWERSESAIAVAGSGGLGP